MWPRRRTKNARTKPRLLDKLVSDLLYMVLEQIRLSEGNSGLLNICLVSRRLYLQTVPHLHRSITFDSTRVSHLSLLDRLARPDSCLPGMIREIGIVSIEETHVEQDVLLQKLSVVFAALRHIEKLDWFAEPLDIPLFILDALHDRFPHAEIAITRQKDWMHEIVQCERFTTLNHPVGSQITSLEVQAFTFIELYDGFKRDLLKMLSQNQVLQRLVVRYPYTLIDFPEMLEQFQQYSLLKLAVLILDTSGQLFTLPELKIWSSKGGFENLSRLGLSQLDELTCFVDSTPNLDEIELYPIHHVDWTFLEEYLCRTDSKKPFGPVRFLVYNGFYNDFGDSQGILDIFPPWFLLDRLPDLLYVAICRAHFDLFHEIALHIPSVQVIQDIRAHLPKLQQIRIVVALSGSCAKWPTGVLAELARFEESMNVLLSSSRETIERANMVNSFVHYLYASRRTCKERRSLEFPWISPHLVVRRSSRIMHLMFNTEYYVHSHEGSFGAYSFCSKQEYYKLLDATDRIDNVIRKARAAEQITRKLLSWDRKSYGKEIQRRELSEGTEGPLTEDVTLYDLCVIGREDNL